MAKCKDCDARIRWVRTAAGRTMPVNEARVSSSDGNVRIVDGVAIVRRSGDPDVAGPCYRAHWADCPAAAERRTKATAKARAEVKTPEPVVVAQPAQRELFKA